MSASYSRRRFLTDLLFVGGALAVSAGLAVVGVQPSEADAASSPQPTPHTPQPQETCEPPMPGQMVAPPPPPSPTPRPQHLPMPGRRAAPERYQTGGKPQAAPPRHP